ncbi:MAG: glucans biosynthesis glucosyltransferase MdoH, partial [Burkholderiaceae bacterium]
VLGVVAVFMRRQQASFGGTAALLRSTVLEAAMALLQAPIRMLAHSLFVTVAITGIKLEWKSPPREAAAVPWGEAVARLSPMTLVIALAGVAIAMVDPSALIWLAPVALPLLLAVPLTVATSHVELGAWMRSRALLLIPEESRSPAVLRRAWRHASTVQARLRAA